MFGSLIRGITRPKLNLMLRSLANLKISDGRVKVCPITNLEVNKRLSMVKPGSGYLDKCVNHILSLDVEV